MGGGDLNSKKSWHPNTMRNQDSVRKAEEMAMNEKRRIKELQHQYDEEKEREELNKKIKSNSGDTDDNRLHWMYNKPDKTVQQEDYLLGKTIDKRSDINKVDDDVIPAVARRVVGSSMMSQTDDSQVDLARKIREDPLLLVKERERAARAALLNNPLQRKKLTELLRREQDQHKVNKAKKKSKKKDKDLDNMLAAKLSAVAGNKGIDLKSLLDSEDSSDEEKTKKKKKKRKHEKKHKKKKRKHSSDEDTDDSDSDKQEKHVKEDSKYNRQEKKDQKESPSRKRKSDSYHEDTESARKRDRGDNRRERERRDSGQHKEEYRKEYPKDRKVTYQGTKTSKGMGEEERAARLAEMVAAGKERETERGRRVAQQRERDSNTAGPTRPPALTEARSLPDSLQSRIHSTRHYIQRDKRHMNEHFARR